MAKSETEPKQALVTVSVIVQPGRSLTHGRDKKKPGDIIDIDERQAAALEAAGHVVRAREVGIEPIGSDPLGEGGGDSKGE